VQVETFEMVVENILLLDVRVTGPIADQEFAEWLERYRDIHLAAQTSVQRLAIWDRWAAY
jgi:hypothetical protein